MPRSEARPATKVGATIRRLSIFLLLVGIAIGGALAFQANTQGARRQSAQGHSVWVEEVLKRMLTIKSGMTRQTLLTVFTTEGGISQALHRRFVSRDCPYFKVDVEFQAVGRPTRDQDGRETSVEDIRDIILKISRPYLQFSVLD